MDNLTVNQIGDNLYSCPFKYAKELGLNVISGDYKSYSNQQWSLSQDGNILLNTEAPEYQSLKEVFEFLAERTDYELNQEYLRLRHIFKDKTLLDIEQYPILADRANLMFYEFIPVELQRRQFINSIESGKLKFCIKL